MTNPISVKEVAKQTLDSFGEGVLGLIKNNPGIINSKIAEKLGIDYDIDNNYLAWSIAFWLQWKNKIKRGKDFAPQKTPLKGWWINE